MFSRALLVRSKEANSNQRRVCRRFGLSCDNGVVTTLPQILSQVGQDNARHSWQEMRTGAARVGDRFASRRLRREPPPASAALDAALAVLSDAADAPRASLDTLVHRHAKALRLDPAERSDATGLVYAVVRSQGRLDWRLRRAELGVSPANLLEAAAALGVAPADGRRRMGGQPWVDPSFRSLLGTGSLESEGMERRVRLECPEWAWTGLLEAFGKDGIEAELRAMQLPAPLDLRVNTLKVGAGGLQILA